MVRAREKDRNEIELRCPRVFGRHKKHPRRVDWEHGYGWDGLVTRVAEVIEEELKDIPIQWWPEVESEENPPLFHLYKTKEKFGVLRFAFRIHQHVPIPQDRLNRIYALVGFTEEFSGTVCEVCGDIGYLCLKKNKGWYKTLCLNCAQTMGYEPVDIDENLPSEFQRPVEEEPKYSS